MNRKEAVKFLTTQPYKFGHLVGFTKLSELHNGWIKSMLTGKEDETLQASRGTYKTTCVSLTLALLCLLLPNYRTLFMRKTDGDVKEVIKQTQKVLLDPHTQYFANTIYGVNLKLNVQSATEIMTNLTTDIKGTSQVVGIGTGASLTGKHFDRIFTDDIVNVTDRISKAEREKTKIVYQELQNIKNRGGRIINTGTPWHEDDAFSIMPTAQKYDCYNKEVAKIISAKELEDLQSKMIPSLFAANYELRFIPSEDIIFINPTLNGNPAMCEQGVMHLDSAFYGKNYTAWSIMRKIGDKYYLYGKMRRKHVDECYDIITEDYNRFNCGKLWSEDNADKGMVAKDLKRQGIRTATYHESMNKYLKIVTYLKAIWNDVIFVEGTDEEYIKQICDYYEDADHDDAPDSAASLARMLYKKKSEREYNGFMM